MQIYEYLRNDHEEVKELLEQLLAVDEDDQDRQQEIVEEIRDAIIPHSRAEERVFYNALRELNADKSEVWHGYKEHMEVETLLRTLQAKEKVGMDWRKTAEKLKESLEHHIADEESTLFTEARKVLTPEEATMIGAAFAKLKPEFQDTGFMKNSIDMVANLMPPRFTKALRLDRPDRSMNA